MKLFLLAQFFSLSSCFTIHLIQLYFLNEILDYQLEPIVLLLSLICNLHIDCRLWLLSFQFYIELVAVLLEFDIMELIECNHQTEEPFYILRSSRHCCMEQRFYFIGIDFDNRLVEHTLQSLQLPLLIPPKCFTLLRLLHSLLLSIFIHQQCIIVQIFNNHQKQLLIFLF